VKENHKMAASSQEKGSLDLSRNLSGRQVSVPDLIRLSRTSVQSPVRCLNLSGTAIKQNLSLILFPGNKLERLILRNCSLTDPSGELDTKHLREIDLSGNPELSSSTINRLIDGLEIVSLSDCPVTVKFPNTIKNLTLTNYQGLNKIPWPQLTHLNLANNDLSSQFEELCSLLVTGINLTHLDLSRTKLTPSQLKTVTDFIPRSVRYLSVSETSFKDLFCLTALNLNELTLHQVKSDHYSNRKFVTEINVKKLTLHSCLIDSGDLKLLGRDHSIPEIELVDCWLDHFSILVDRMIEMKTKKFSLSYSDNYPWQYRIDYIAEQWTQQLIELIRLGTLDTLSLINFKFELSSLTDQLVLNQSVRHLIFRKNKIKSIHPIMEMLEFNRTLVTIDLSGNKVVCSRAYLKSLIDNNIIQEIKNDSLGINRRIEPLLICNRLYSKIDHSLKSTVDLATDKQSILKELR